MNRHWLFWITFGSIITLCELFIFILVISCIENFIFHKEYCLFLLPNLIYLVFQFIVNYGILIESLDNIKKFEL